MRIIPLDEKHIPQARQWLNRLIEGDGLVYKPLDEAAFEGAFWRSLPQARRHTALLERDDGQLAGLAGGVSMPLAGKAYISFVAVDAALRRQGWGTRLLAWLEEQLTSLPEGRPEKLEIVFFNPASFTWIVPGTAGHDHPNAPGVDVASGAYLFFKNRGYRDFAMQNAYHLPLAQYEYPAALAQRLAALGMDVKLGANITQITPEAVLLADGSEIPAEIVLVSAGVRANVQLAQAAGLACGRAVTVDDHMRTSDPDIFACGDCAELNGVNMALWGEAQNQGRTAGTNAAGGDAVCPPESGALVLNALKTTLFSIGDCGKENRTYKVVTRPGKKPDSYARYWFCDGLLRGAILLDDLSSMARITKLMRQNATEEETLA